MLYEFPSSLWQGMFQRKHLHDAILSSGSYILYVSCNILWAIAIDVWLFHSRLSTGPLWQSNSLWSWAVMSLCSIFFIARKKFPCHNQLRITRAVIYKHIHKCLESNLTGIPYQSNKRIVPLPHRGLLLQWYRRPIKGKPFPAQKNKSTSERYAMSPP